MKFFAISDLHFSPYTKWGDFDGVISVAKEEKPDYILIAGDIFNCIADYYADRVCERAVRVLTRLAKVAPVVAVTGNHDYAWETGATTEKMYRDERVFETLKRIPDFHLLENEWLRTPEVDFYGLEKDGDYYYPRENREGLVESVGGLKVEKGKVSVLLFHSPLELCEISTDFDVTVSGHTHEGMVPNLLRRMMRRGIIGPYFKVFPKHVFSEGKHVVLPAWEMLPTRPRWLQVMRGMYKRRGVIIEIDPVEKSITLVEKILEKSSKKLLRFGKK